MMQAAVLSDTHLGDPDSKLAQGTQSASYRQLRRVIKERTGGKPLDYLILSGDILDFSIASFEEACNEARPFFCAIQCDKLARQIIYVPGNHDKHVWDAAEWETRIIRRMKKYDDPLPFRRTQPALLDLENERFELANVHKVEGTDRWGSLFLEGLFNDKENSLPINIAYPNLYVKTANDIYLITHGHMLEMAWVLLSEVFGDVNGLRELKPLSLGRLEELNVPLTAMICTGVGQAGELSKICYEVEVEAKQRETGRLREVLEKGIPRISSMLDLSCFKRFVLRKIKDAVLRMVAERSLDSRYDEWFFTDRAVQERFWTFYMASRTQARESFGLAPPRKIIFGHTHIARTEKDPLPIKREARDIPGLPGDKVYLYNTGGWLKNEDQGPERDPLVFFFDDGGLASVRISE
jgi:predicted phosphodiesterase